MYSIIIPTLNEGANLWFTLQQVKSNLFKVFRALRKQSQDA